MSFHEALYTGNAKETRANLEWPDSKFISISGPVDKTGRTPLHVAAEFGHAELAQYLIQHGASVNDFGHWSCNCTPLQIATHKGHGDLAALLKSHGAKDYPMRQPSYLVPNR